MQRVLAVALSFSAAALLIAVGLPHQHDGSAATHPAQSCRACKIQDGFAAAPSSHHASPLSALPAARTPQNASRIPHADVTVRPFAPRAPPAFS